MIELRAQIDRFPIEGSFTIARGSKKEAVVVTVTVRDGEKSGHGECVPYARYGETPESVLELIESARTPLARECTRLELQSILPAGAARNAVDCALWDLEAKRAGKRAYELAGISALKPVTTAYTISLGTADVMFEATKKVAHRKLLKIKLGAPDGDIERIRAVRKAAPESVLIADANEGWTPANISAHLEACREARFSLIEQPISAAADEFLRGLNSPVPLCADESVHDRRSIERLVGLYKYINLKLDKTGGLTEALELARLAEAKGLGLMIGCMVGTSLAMAPALVLAARAEFVDLDGPLLLARDRVPGLVYEDSLVHPPSAELWG